MNVWLMTDPMFWVTLGAWSGFCVGLFTGALMTWWYCHRGVRRASPLEPFGTSPRADPAAAADKQFSANGTLCQFLAGVECLESLSPTTLVPHSNPPEFIYGVSASRGHGVERAPHLRFDALNGAGPDAALTSDFENAGASPEVTLDSFFEGRGNSRPSELFALLYSSLKPGMDSLANHAAFELGKGACNLKHQAAGGRRSID